MIGRFLGWLLVTAALIVLGRDVMHAAMGGPFRLSSLGSIWYALHPGSLNLLQAATERYLSPAGWDRVLFTFLQWPAVLDLGVPGLLLLFLFGRR